MSEKKMTKVPMLQLLGGFVFVMAVGFAIVFLVGKSDKEIASGQALLQGYQLTQYGSDMCKKAIKEHTGAQLYAPLKTTGDRISTLTVVWEGVDDKFKKAECSYIKGRGIVSLIIDGKKIERSY